MSYPTIERRRTVWDVVAGILLVILAFVVLGHSVLATAVSVLFLGWTLLLGGVILMVSSLFRIRSGGFWSAVLGGAVLTVLGLVLLRNTAAAIVTLTLVAGAVIFVEGLVRLVSALQNNTGLDRVLLVVSGAISILLGMAVLFNVFAASFVVLGTILGVHTLMNGLTLLTVGRMRVVTAGEALPSRA